MEKEKWYHTSREFRIGLIVAILCVVSVPLYLFVKWYAPNFIERITHPSVTQVSGTYYGNADFGVVVNPIDAPPAGTASVFFYKEMPDGALRRIARISGMPPATGRPGFSKDGTLYFPEFKVPFSHMPDYYVVKVKGKSVQKINTGKPNGEFVVSVDGKVFVDTNGKLEVFDTGMNDLIKTITLPEGENFFHIYRYGGKVYALETSKTDTILREVDPNTLKITKTLHFNFAVTPDGNHCAIVRFKGKVYATGYDEPLKVGTYVHRVIYELTDTITPVYVYPEKVELCNAIENCRNKAKLHSEDPHISFSFNAFVPINPEKKEFLLLGRTSLLAKKVHYYVFDTLTGKFTEVPPEFMLNGDDELMYDTGVYSKGKVYIATARYLLRFEKGTFTIVDRFGRRKYDTVAFKMESCGN